jgi:hypothetical protein
MELLGQGEIIEASHLAPMTPPNNQQHQIQQSES